MLEDDPNLTRRMIVCQGIEKVLPLYHILYDKKKASTIQTTLDTFLRNKTL